MTWLLSLSVLTVLLGLAAIVVTGLLLGVIMLMLKAIVEESDDTDL